MANLEYIQQLMTELGPLVDEICLVKQSGDNLWLVAYDEDTAVEIECDEPANKLTLAMPVGPVKGEARLEWYEAMLSYNYLYRETGGMRMSIEGADGNVVLLVDLCHLDLQINTLAGFLQAVVEAGRGWREALTGQVDESITDEHCEDLAGALQV